MKDPYFYGVNGPLKLSFPPLIVKIPPQKKFPGHKIGFFDIFQKFVKIITFLKLKIF